MTLVVSRMELDAGVTATIWAVRPCV